jgi:hypothetical protein
MYAILAINFYPQYHFAAAASLDALNHGDHNLAGYNREETKWFVR